MRGKIRAQFESYYVRSAVKGYKGVTYRVVQ